MAGRMKSTTAYWVFAWGCFLSMTTNRLPAEEAQDESAAKGNAESFLNEDGLIPVDKAIASFEKRLAASPKNASLQRLLGQLYLRKAKEQGDHLAYQQAEQVFRLALDNDPDDLIARTYLAVALQAQHQFERALEFATTVFEKSPTNSLALAAIGDCQLELGRYQAAEKTIEKLAELAQGPAILARRARLAELHGRQELATKLLTDGLRDIQDAGGLPSLEAWFEWRLGQLAFDSGRLSRANRHFRNAIAIDSSNAPAIVGLARVSAAEGQHGDAIATLYGAVEEFGEPPMMAMLGDIYTKLGDTEEATHWYEQAEKAMEEEAVHAAAAHYREVAMFYADHNMKPKRALELAKKDFSLRQDIYGHDMLAWTLYRNNQYQEAAKSIKEAMKLGTQDAQIYFHASLIYDAIGQPEVARKMLAKAVDINPHFSILHSDTLEKAANSSAE